MTGVLKAYAPWAPAGIFVRGRAPKKAPPLNQNKICAITVLRGLGGMLSRENFSNGASYWYYILDASRGLFCQPPPPPPQRKKSQSTRNTHPLKQFQPHYISLYPFGNFYNSPEETSSPSHIRNLNLHEKFLVPPQKL